MSLQVHLAEVAAVLAVHDPTGPMGDERLAQLTAEQILDGGRMMAIGSPPRVVADVSLEPDGLYVVALLAYLPDSEDTAADWLSGLAVQAPGGVRWQPLDGHEGDERVARKVGAEPCRDGTLMIA